MVVLEVQTTKQTFGKLPKGSYYVLRDDVAEQTLYQKSNDLEYINIRSGERYFLVRLEDLEMEVYRVELGGMVKDTTYNGYRNYLTWYLSSIIMDPENQLSFRLKNYYFQLNKAARTKEGFLPSLKNYFKLLIPLDRQYDYQSPVDLALDIVEAGLDTVDWERLVESFFYTYVGEEE